MGWNGAGEIFEPIATAILDSDMDDGRIEEVLTLLISQLQNADWDTEDESLEEFLDYPAVVKAFATCGVVNREKCDECGRDYDD